MFLFLLAFSGLWDTTININGNQIPFRLEISGNQGWFFNGNERVVSTSGRFEDDKLILKFDHYATTLEATLKDGALEGRYGPYAKEFRPFVATRHIASAAMNAHAPNIDGEWEIAVDSSKGEHAWRLLVHQDKTAELSATILRVDGDTGTLTGAYRDGHFVLSHFSGARPSLLVLNEAADGTLAVELTGPKGKAAYVAKRPGTARALGLPAPDNPEQHTGVKNTAEPFTFSFPDLAGRIVANTDARFQGKVVLVNIMGSWCPNCHDEAPFLAELYREYRKADLEIVGISFEDGEQFANPARLRFFVQNYKIEYPVLLGGETTDAPLKLPQAANLDSWPTTFFIGRDGRVRAVRAGFAGPASGAVHRQAKAKFRAQIERLLAENLHEITKPVVSASYH